MILKNFDAYADGRALPVQVTEIEGGWLATIRKRDIPAGTRHITAFEDTLAAAVGEQGCHLVSGDSGICESYATYFTPRADGEININNGMPVLPFWARLGQGYGVLAMPQTERYSFSMLQSYRDGVYRVGVRYEYGGHDPHEDIRVAFYILRGNITPFDIAKLYREKRLAAGEIRYIDDKRDEELSYARDSVLVRVRMGWKPAPPTVLEQTPENEPQMYVACDFAFVRELADRLKAKGVERAEITLIGWNISGHDGRWPQYFPVDERFGGQIELKKTIAHVQALGYRLTLHLNITDAYTVADNFDENEMIRLADGSLSYYHPGWSGGRMYHVCAKTMYEKYKGIWERVASLGVRGLNYTDVLSILSPRQCFDERHKCTYTESARELDRMARLSCELFGGFSSEGGRDFCADNMGYALYVAMKGRERSNKLVDAHFPLWHMIYSGVVLSNPYCSCVNYPIKPRENELYVREMMARPSFYLWSRFYTDGSGAENWMGDDDLRPDTPEELDRCVDIIARAYREYDSYRHLHGKRWESYEACGAVRTVTYPDGTKVVVDYEKMDWKIER